MVYKKEILSHHIGVRTTPQDGKKLLEVAAILRLTPSDLARKIILDYIYGFDAETDRNVKR